MSIPYWVFKRPFNVDTLEQQEGFSESPFLDGLEIFFRSITSLKAYMEYILLTRC